MSLCYIQTICSTSEAVEAILKYSPNELSILKRKSITREILFEYLHQQNAAIPIPTTKSTLIDKICQLWNLHAQPYKHEEPSNNACTTSATPEVNVDLLGEKFSEWFYNMVNTSPIIGPEHFWRDAVLTLHLISEAQTVTEVIQDDCEKIALLLSNTKTTHNLFFNPNLTKEGIKSRMSPHGLVIVMVCGTLHTDNQCVGVFEQVFGLARDPFSENNWKIKNTELNLRSKSGVTRLPRLCDSVESNALSITEC